MYIAASGMLSDMVRQDAIASNLANVSTTGYKRDQVTNETFSEMFLSNLRNNDQVGSLSLGTRVSGVVTDFAQGSLRPTEEAMDVALSGDGFFVVQTPAGYAYTRSGQFTRDAQGFMTTQDGNYVLGTTNQPIFIGQGDPSISQTGEIVVQGQPVGRLNVVTLDMDTAQKAGAKLWVGTPTGAWPQGTGVRQGYLEASATNSVEEMVRMIETMRSYESNQRVLQSLDQTLGKAVNEVGSLQ